MRITMAFIGRRTETQLAGSCRIRGCGGFRRKKPVAQTELLWFFPGGDRNRATGQTAAKWRKEQAWMGGLVSSFATLPGLPTPFPTGVCHRFPSASPAWSSAGPVFLKPAGSAHGGFGKGLLTDRVYRRDPCFQWRYCMFLFEYIS